MEQRLKGDERVSWVILSGEREFQPEGTASAKILRYDHLECSRNSKDASVVGAEGGSNNRLRPRCEGWERFLYSLGGRCQYLDFE